MICFTLILCSCDFPTICFSTGLVGYCVPRSDNDQKAGAGFCVNGTNNGYEYSDTYCKTKYTAIPIVIMVIYVLVFAAGTPLPRSFSGFAPMPWVLNAEFYPLWARSTCVSFSTATKWGFDLLVSLTFLSLSQAVTKFGLAFVFAKFAGTFFLYAGITVIALVFTVMLVPETMGQSIEQVEGSRFQRDTAGGETFYVERGTGKDGSLHGFARKR